MAPTEEKVFFFPGSGRRNLFGFLHYPAPAAANHIGIIYCHPFAEEKNMSHAIVVQTARMLAEQGFAVLRFDLSGCGDSQGNLGEVTVEDWQEDLDAAIEILFEESNVSKYILWGLRLGAGLALMQGKQRKDASLMILWQPVVDFSIHLQQFLRRTISSQISGRNNADHMRIDVAKELEEHGVIHITGYPVSRKLYDSFNATARQPLMTDSSIPAIVLSISPADKPSPAQINSSDQIRKTRVMVTFKHVQEQPFWDRYWQWECKKVGAVTSAWLNRQSLTD